MFIASVAYSVISFHIGRNPYGYILFQGHEDAYKNKISLFGISIVASAFLSFFVFWINVVVKNGFFRLPVIFTSFYFLVFSGNRTLMVCLVLALGLQFINKLRPVRNPRLYLTCIFLVPIIFVVAMAVLPYWMASLSIENEHINYFLFHTTSGLGSSEDIIEQIARPIIWMEHLKLFLSSPLIGNGYVSLVGTHNFAGSESFITEWLAKVGILIIPFVLFFVRIAKRALECGNLFSSHLVLCIFIIMLSYGNFLVPFNLLYFILFAMFNLDGPLARVDNFELPLNRGVGG
jgi:hypothetical protein